VTGSRQPSEGTAGFVSRASETGGVQVGGGTAGDIIFRDGGASGAIKLQFNIGTGSQPIGLTLPADGILFVTDIHITLATGAKITAYTQAV
jgi:hypothetical protein